MVTMLMMMIIIIMTSGRHLNSEIKRRCGGPRSGHLLYSLRLLPTLPSAELPAAGGVDRPLGLSVWPKRYSEFGQLDRQLRLVAPPTALAELKLPPKGGLGHWLRSQAAVGEARLPLLNEYLAHLDRLTDWHAEAEHSGIGRTTAAACRGVLVRWLGAPAKRLPAPQQPDEHGGAAAYFGQVEALRVAMEAAALGGGAAVLSAEQLEWLLRSGGVPTSAVRSLAIRTRLLRTVRNVRSRLVCDSWPIAGVCRGPGRGRRWRATSWRRRCTACRRPRPSTASGSRWT